MITDRVDILNTRYDRDLDGNLSYVALDRAIHLIENLAVDAVHPYTPVALILNIERYNRHARTYTSSGAYIVPLFDKGDNDEGVIARLAYEVRDERGGDLVVSLTHDKLVVEAESLWETATGVATVWTSEQEHQYHALERFERPKQVLDWGAMLSSKKPERVDTGRELADLLTSAGVELGGTVMNAEMTRARVPHFEELLDVVG